MQYLELPPAPSLRRWVRCYWFLSGEGVSAEPVLPDGCPELIFNLADPFAAHAGDGGPVRQPAIMLVGQITGPMVIGPTGRVEIVAVRFEPWGAGLLWRNQAELVGRWLTSADIPGSGLDRAWHRLGETAGAAARATILDATLGDLARRGRALDPTVELAARTIVETNGAVPLGPLTQQLGTTPRQLQRRFAAEVGISPKLLARVSRFQRVLAAWREQPGSWARVAARCGYFDQSHLVRDFRDFSGSAPVAFLAAGSEFSRLFTALRGR